MMGRQSGQMSMVILDIAELIPSDHLLRKIKQISLENGMDVKTLSTIIGHVSSATTDRF